MEEVNPVFIVIKEFHDLQDFKETKAGPIFHHYQPGDAFPRAGKKVSIARVQSLASAENAQGEALIAEVVSNTNELPIPEEKPADTPKKGTKKTKAKKTPKNSTVEKSSEKKAVK